MDPAPKPVKENWWLSRRIAILGLVVVGPLALPLVWLSPKFSVIVKILITVATIVLTVLMWKMTLVSLARLKAQWAELQSLSGS